MLGGADNPNGELPSYITGANNGRRCVDLARTQEAVTGIHDT